MTDIEDALARSSLGTPEARAAIDATPVEMGQYIVSLHRVHDLAAEVGLGDMDDYVAWLNAPNRALGNKRPRDLIKNGETEPVTALLQALAEGAFL